MPHSRSGRHYVAEWKDGRLWHREFLSKPDLPETPLASYSMDWQIGSGHAARSFLFSDDGFLVQSPLTWYADRGRWHMSPGYDYADHAAFRRVAEEGCLFCHTGRLERIEDSPFRYRIAEAGIGCER